MQIWKKLNSRVLYRHTLATVVMQAVFLGIQFVTIEILFADDIAANPRIATNITLLLGVSVLLLISWALLQYTVAKRSLGPLSEIVLSVQSACQGDIGHKVEVTTEDEIGDAGAARTTRCST